MIAVVLAHVWNIATGIVASLACAASFYLVGAGLVHRRWQDSLGSGESAAILGTALYVLVCWFGITLGVPLGRLAVGFSAVGLVILVVRHRWFVAQLGRDGRRWTALTRGLAAFVVLYILAYLFTMPPVTANYLPVAWNGNIDLLTYARYTKYLFQLGPSNLAGMPTMLNDVYRQTPGVFYVLGWLSLLVDRDPLRAAMPVQFALTALIGLYAERISRSVFSLSRWSAFVIACILVSGPFFRYVAVSYFLSSLMTIPVVLYLVWTTLTARPVRLLDPSLAIRFGSAYVILLFMYPFLLIAAVAVQLAAIALLLIAERQSRVPEAYQRAVRTTVAVFVPLATIAIALYPRLKWSLTMVMSLTQPGIAGWPIDIVSPWALLGLPAVRTDYAVCMECFGVEAAGPLLRYASIATFCAIGLGLGALYFFRYRDRTSPVERAAAGLAGGSLIVYCVYFLLLGPSYQQWKFASYAALPMSFLVLGAAWTLVRRSNLVAGLGKSAAGHHAVITVPAVFAAACIGGNLVVHTSVDPRLQRLPGELRNLQAVDELPFFKDVTIQMSDVPSQFPTWVALYFLPSKTVHVISQRFAPSEVRTFEQLSKARPMFIQDFGCEGVGHDQTMTIPDVGCLLLAPPSPVLGTPYPFNQSFLFLRYDGLGERKPWGRANDHATVRLDLSVDVRLTAVHQDRFVNLLLATSGPLFAQEPYHTPRATEQRLTLSWGDGHKADVMIGEREWISLPVRTDDWTGNWIWTVPVSVEVAERAGVDMPGQTGHGGRPLTVVFEALSLTGSPQGRVPTGETRSAAKN